MAVDEFSDYPDTGASGSQEYTSPQDPSIEFTSKNPRGDYDPPQPNADYGVGATGNVSTSGRTNSGGGLVAPFVHPFKLERFTNPDDNSTKVRVYEGDVYAKIDTFQLAIITITTGASHTHSAGSYAMPDHSHNQGGTAAAKTGTAITEGDTGSGTDHTHSVSGLTATVAEHSHSSQGTVSGTDQKLTIKQHTHLPRNGSEDGLVMPDHIHASDDLTAQAKEGSSITEGTTIQTTNTSHTHSSGTLGAPMGDHYHTSGGSGVGSGQQLKFRQHTHSLPNTTGGPTSGSGGSSGGSYGGADSSHTHDLGGSTGNVDGFGGTPPAPEDITGNTGGIPHSLPSQAVEGSTGAEDSHSHNYNKDDHSHSVTGNTDQVTNYDSNKKITGNTGNIVGFEGSENPEEVQGNTGGIVGTPPSGSIDGTLANESSHTHKYNKDDHSHTLEGQTGGLYSSAGIINTSGTNSNSAATHNIVVIAGQDQPDPVNPISTTWTTAFNKFVLLDDGSNSLFKYHESSHADGDFYVKWVITIDGDAKVQTVVGSIHRVAVGAARPDDNPFGDLTQSNTGVLTRAQNTGTFYQKIGTVNGGIVQQKQFSNINWSMTVLPTVS